MFLNISKETKYFFKVIIIMCIIGFGVNIPLTQLDIIKYGSPIFMLFYAISGYSPSVAGLMTIKKYSSKEYFKSFLKNCINIKRSFGEYLYILVTNLILWTVPYLVISNFKDGFALLNSPLIFLSFITPVMILGGGLEEIGWRGFLLPKLLKRYSEFNSTLIISVIWSVWHLPLWFVVGSHQQGTSFIAFALSCVASSFILTFIYTQTHSVWLCILFHALDNACFYIFSFDVTLHILISFSTALAGIIIFLLSNKYLKNIIR